MNIAFFEEDADTLERVMSLQSLINSGVIWKLEGSSGRAAMENIKSGAVMLGHSPKRDAYGNYVPGRDQVKTGTKGSFEYVAERMGEAYARKLARVA